MDPYCTSGNVTQMQLPKTYSEDISKDYVKLLQYVTTRAVRKSASITVCALLKHWILEMVM